jgi:hypothetical protein
MSIGPGSSTDFIITPAISETLLDHTSYVSNLSLWDKFLIWRYTLGSGAINFSLVGIAKDDQISFWCYQFFKSWRYPPKYIHSRFRPYLRYFENPKELLYRSDKLSISKSIISKFIHQLERIILSAPRNHSPFYVYKVSSKYPELPEESTLSVNSIVFQKPFNSTTYNPQFNFAPFIAEDATCCLHKILIPKGSRMLLIPSEFHAYPHEMECLLPFGSSFKVESITNNIFFYIPKEQQRFILTQNLNDLRIGQVYLVDPVSDNTTKRKTLKYYISTFLSDY